jgi:hypothetical protein
LSEIENSKNENFQRENKDLEFDDVGKVPYASLRYFKKL